MINNSLYGKSVLGMDSLSAIEIDKILDIASKMKKILISDYKKTSYLRGKSVVNLFFENSTRTRSSFELAGKYLGADVINISKSGSSMTKGESVKDTLLTMAAMEADAVVIRDSSEGSAFFASEIINHHIKMPIVINAGDGAHEHPSQTLLEMLTLKESGVSFKGMKLAILGDILHSRVARSDIKGFIKMGAKVYLYGPATLVPKEFESMGAVVASSMEEALEGADAVNVLRIQLERAARGFFPTLREYSRLFGLNSERLKLAKKNCKVLHPGPMNRGIEISYDVAYNEKSWIQEEVRNGVAVRMALLYLTMTEGNDLEITD
ncbi:MAG: aspartate carbamoyltransferase catalytic subunit [Dialister micraerophilus]|uniref:aspartate carbamoyltransferase catalytic subunit n=1 Tax=Dialister micraerophilus TaxID=309120 RepID=UPI0023F4D556|nr:aspartate carbamoyltransferase catalytic subunit [Dialister micraerophilus]MDK8285934.1 aspartate carbamoyltransferase catalytic subunit [Dialister micraerophilus]MDU1772677.1 aspartate carbamoyltransferase catalytic subunit [Dialister micraerophilus]